MLGTAVVAMVIGAISSEMALLYGLMGNYTAFVHFIRAFYALTIRLGSCITNSQYQLMKMSNWRKKTLSQLRIVQTFQIIYSGALTRYSEIM